MGFVRRGRQRGWWHEGEVRERGEENTHRTRWQLATTQGITPGYSPRGQQREQEPKASRECESRDDGSRPRSRVYAGEYV